MINIINENETITHIIHKWNARDLFYNTHNNSQQTLTQTINNINNYKYMKCNFM